MGKGQNKEKGLGDKTKQEFDTVGRELSWPECHIRKEKLYVVRSAPRHKEPLHKWRAEHVSKKQKPSFAEAGKWAFAATV